MPLTRVAAVLSARKFTRIQHTLAAWVDHFRWPWARYLPCAHSALPPATADPVAGTCNESVATPPLGSATLNFGRPCCAVAASARLPYMNIAKLVLPRQARQWMRRTYNEIKLDRAMRHFIADPTGAIRTDSGLLQDLTDGWGNTGWSAQEDYLRTAVSHALETEGAILECGTGLSTLLLAAVAKQRGLQYWALEHSEHWSDRVRHHLVRHNLSSVVRVFVGPLRDYDEYTWYDPPLPWMRESFSLVICDGPPSDTPGGRYGLVPVMRSRLAPGCVILLDDAIREQEQVIARRWQSDLKAECTLIESRWPFIRMVVPSRRQEAQVHPAEIVIH